MFQITRIQNLQLYRQYSLCRNEIGKHVTDMVLAEKRLWHNTTRGDVDDINANGFRGNFTGGLCSNFPAVEQINTCIM